MNTQLIKKERPGHTMDPLPNTMDIFKISPQGEPGHLPLRATLWEMSAGKPLKQVATNLYHDRCFPVIYLEHRDPVKTPKYKNFFAYNSGDSQNDVLS